MTPDQNDSGARGYAKGYEYFAMAFSFAIAILLFGALGWLVDGGVNTRPLFTILGAFLGGFAGFMRIYYRVKADTAANKGSGEGRRRGGA